MTDVQWRLMNPERAPRYLHPAHHRLISRCRSYLVAGLCQFQRSFVLADGIEVVSADLDNGLLHVDLVRPKVESRERTIEIRSGAARTPRLKTVDVEPEEKAS